MVKLKDMYIKYECDGIITRDNFVKLLESLDIHLSEDDVNTLCKIMKNKITYSKIKIIFNYATESLV